jgi:hypothetical protein
MSLLYVWRLCLAGGKCNSKTRSVVWSADVEAVIMNGEFG